MESFITVINAIIPVLLIISLGYFLKYLSFFKDHGWDSVERLTYYVFFPALIIHEITHAEFTNSDFLKTVVALNCALILMFFISFFAWGFRGMNGPKFSSIVQNNIRWNSYVVLGITTALFPEHVPIVVLSIAFMLPTANILSVWTLLIWGNTEARGNINSLTGLIKNPLILACLVGGLLYYYQIKIPIVASNAMMNLGHAAMPLGLLAVGAGIDFERMKYSSVTRMSWAFTRLLGFPAAAFLCCHLFGITDKTMILMAMMTSCAPTSSNAYILARQLGGDAPFMASLIGTSTVFSIVTIPFLIFLYGHYYL